MDLPPPVTVSLLAVARDAILLVEQRGPDDPAPRWMLPGGRLEPGESLVGGLAREVLEETGLRLDGDPGIAFLVEADSAGGRYSAITFACRVAGEIRPGDPDRFVRHAEWTPTDRAIARLRAVEWYDCGPLERYLRDPRPAPVYGVDRR